MANKKSGREVQILIMDVCRLHCSCAVEGPRSQRGEVESIFEFAIKLQEKAGWTHTMFQAFIFGGKAQRTLKIGNAETRDCAESQKASHVRSPSSPRRTWSLVRNRLSPKSLLLVVI